MTTAGHLPESSKVFHERAKEYDSWFDESLLFEIETAAIRALSIPVTAPALEIGVGPGRFAKALGSGFGIDPALAPLHIARSRDIAVCQAIGEALPFRNNSVARVSLFFTLCFVQNPVQIFRESYRVLQDEAYFILGFVPATSEWGKNLQQKKENNHPFYEHARFFTVQEVETLLKDRDFAISNSVSTLYQAPGEVTRIESPQSGMDENAGFVVLAATKTETQ
ncbi:MAG: class I SAM-dependent methyltransferase [Thermodesulfobacteriota bacterium]|nr:class I SAM-dependent methyltransferase [Thermodesulfobacteriota bacterium]